MRSMKEIDVSHSIGSRCAGSQVVIDLRLALILTPLINTSTFMQVRAGSEVKGEECRPQREVKCASCASASFISRLQGKQPRRRFDTVLSQQMDRNEIVMWGSTEANLSHAALVGQAWGHPRPLACIAPPIGCRLRLLVCPIACSQNSVWRLKFNFAVRVLWICQARHNDIS